MKQFKSYKWQVITALLFVFLYGCQDNNEPELLFDDLPSVRIKKKIAEVKSFLQESKNGWKVAYFPDDTQLGGFTFLFNFISDNEVKMHSDFGNPDPNRVSLYDITFGSTAKLTFTTKNVIHELSDGANSPDADLRGKGYKGDFEFLFSSIDGDDIIFRSNRDTSNYLRFKKASNSDWIDLSKNREIQDKMSNNPLKSIFRKLTIEDKIYNFSYFSERRRIIGTHPDLEYIDIGIAFTTTGIIVNPAINVGDKKVTELTYNSENDTFVYEEEGSVLASIEYTNTPTSPLNPYDFGKEAGNIRILRTNGRFISIDESSAAFVNFFEDWKQFFTSEEGGRSISRVYIRGLYTDNPYMNIYYFSGSTELNIRFPLTYAVTETSNGNRIVKFTEVGMETNRRTGSQPMIDFIFRDSGFYVQKMTPLPFQNTIGLIPVDNTRMLVHWYDF